MSSYKADRKNQAWYGKQKVKVLAKYHTEKQEEDAEIERMAAILKEGFQERRDYILSLEYSPENDDFCLDGHSTARKAAISRAHKGRKQSPEMVAFRSYCKKMAKIQGKDWVKLKFNPTINYAALSAEYDNLRRMGK